MLGEHPNPNNCPRGIRESIDLYVKSRIPSGSFVHAVLTNNLTEAFLRADSYNLESLKHIVAYVHWNIPAPCHGSEEKVRAWLENKQEK